jgi:alanine racemase
MADLSLSSHTGAPPVPAGVAAWAEVDCGAIADNVRELKRRAGSAEVMAVVKADGYGHGIVESARAAVAGGATYLGVAQLAEALALRATGVQTPILSWLYVPGADFAGAIAHRIDISASSTWSLEAIAEAARQVGTTARVHLKVDTGLGRNGAWGQDWAELIRRAARLDAEHAVDVVGIWSHFVYADAPEHPTVRAQQERFVEAVGELEREGVTPTLRHLANSAATLTNPSAQFDMVRPGVAVYGLSPVPQIGGPPHFGLTEAMTVRARLALVKDAPAGQGISYGHEYTTSRATRLGLVPLGYADGIPRNGTNVGPAQVAAQRLTVAGRVCMDQFVLDLGPDSPAAPGDDLVVVGREARGEPTAQDWAAATGTINYEIVTRIGARVPRVHLDPGQAGAR